MSDPIERQAAIELIHSLYPSEPIMQVNRKWWKKKYKPYIEAEKALEQLPSAEPERKTGHWINISISVTGESEAECDQCGCVIHNSFSNSVNYCPNCGADMRGNCANGY